MTGDEERVPAAGGPADAPGAGDAGGAPDPGIPPQDEAPPQDEVPPQDEAPPQVEAPPPAPPPDPADRRVEQRLARLHLRMGSLALARAELEALAGRGTLDDAALLDLAEARWRTGDTAGAGEAANAVIERGVAEPLAWVIAAEAAAALGRPAEARRLAGEAMTALDGGLDALFAGMPRSPAWPGEPEVDGAALLAVAGRQARAGRGEDASPASAGAAEAFAGGRAALGAGDPATAALRFGVAIRLEPKYAQAALAVIGDRAADPFLALVAGDALRLLGREQEAVDAYDRARGRSRGAEAEDAAGPWPEGEDA